MIETGKADRRIISSGRADHHSEQDGAYGAKVTPPHGGGKPWSSPHSMSRVDLVAALRRIGCHQMDIGDAFFEADPDWLDR
jgi:hypothetical protein